MIMIIKAPITPQNDTEPGEIPYTIPETENFQPVTGLLPPTWKDFAPAPVRVGGNVYALLPVGISYFVGMAGCAFDAEQQHQTPPAGLDYMGTMTRYLPDMSIRHIYGRPYHWFSESIAVPSQWTGATIPAGFSLPNFPGNFVNPGGEPLTYYSPFLWEMISGGTGVYPEQNVIWGLWGLWRGADYDPGVLWSPLMDIYIESYFIVYYQFFVYARAKRGMIIPPAMTILLALMTLLISGAVQHTANNGRRLRTCRKQH